VPSSRASTPDPSSQSSDEHSGREDLGLLWNRKRSAGLFRTRWGDVTFEAVSLPLHSLLEAGLGQPPSQGLRTISRARAVWRVLSASDQAARGAGEN
jgi:hypothetical protein